MTTHARIELEATDAWRAAFPGACAGLLQIEGASNPDSDYRLDALLDATAADLRGRYGRLDRPRLLALEPFEAYAGYYRRFDKTYHVLLQLESVALKDKPLRARGALVAAMFRAELLSGLLTAGHDATRIAGRRIVVDVVSARERYTGIGGHEIDAAAGDMVMRDAAGLVSTVVYGPDERTRLEPSTTYAVFATYAPAGIGRDAVRREFECIAEGIRLVSPGAAVIRADVVEAV